MVEFDFIPLENGPPVNEYGPLALRCHEEIPAVSEPDRGLLAGHLRGRTLEAQVHVDWVVPSASADRDLRQMYKVEWLECKLQIDHLISTPRRN